MLEVYKYLKLISFRTWFIGAAIPKGEFAKWDNQALSIPALPPSIINSRVVNVTYHVVIEVDVPWGFDPTINMPITMGTIPFRPAYQQITVSQIDLIVPPMGKKFLKDFITDTQCPILLEQACFTYQICEGIEPGTPSRCSNLLYNSVIML